MELWISTFFAVPYRTFLNTLAHEMIHVLITTEYPREAIIDPHGYEFMKEAQRINNMGLGFNITKTNGENLQISNQTKERFSGKELIVILIDIDGKYSVSVTSPQVYERENNKILGIFKYAIKSRGVNRVELNIITSNNPELLKYRQQRSYASRLTHAPISDELLEDLLDNGNIIRTITITKENVEDSANGSYANNTSSGGFSGVFNETSENDNLETILIS